MLFQDKCYPKILQISLNDFLSDRYMCDVTLIVDGHEYQAHKLVLSAASPYFRIMFNSEFSFMESKQDKVNLHGVDGDALSDILKFIYSSAVEINDENVYSLMEAANLLQIHALRSFISFYLKNTLTVDNCLQLYVMASLHQYHDLANIAFHFLLINFSKVVVKDEFLELPFENLLEIVSSRLMDIPNEEFLYEHVLRWVKADTENRKQHLDSLLPQIDLHLFSTDFLTKIKNNSLISTNLRKKIEQVTNYPSLETGMMHVFGKENQYYYQKVRYKAEKAVIFAIGGEYSGMASQTVECFTSGYDKWRYVVPEYVIKRQETRHTNVLPPLMYARYSAAFANDAYNVYVIGGKKLYEILDECEVFNVRANQWKYIQKFPLKLYGSGAVFLEKELFVVGGFGEKGISDKMWKLDKVHNTWIPMPPLLTPRFYSATIAVGGYIFVFGGFNEKQRGLKTCEKFDPSCNKWFEISSMNQPRAKFGCASIDEFIYIFGGTSDMINCVSIVERYNIFTNEWSIECRMTIPRHSFSVAVSGHEVYVLGGSDGTHFLDTVEKFNLRTKLWHYVHSMQVSRQAPAAAALLVPYES